MNFFSLFMNSGPSPVDYAIYKIMIFFIEYGIYNESISVFTEVNKIFDLMKPGSNLDIIPMVCLFVFGIECYRVLWGQKLDEGIGRLILAMVFAQACLLQYGELVTGIFQLGRFFDIHLVEPYVASHLNQTFESSGDSFFETFNSVISDIGGGTINLMVFGLLTAVIYLISLGVFIAGIFRVVIPCVIGSFVGILGLKFCIAVFPLNSTRHYFYKLVKYLFSLSLYLPLSKIILSISFWFFDESLGLLGDWLKLGIGITNPIDAVKHVAAGYALMKVPTYANAIVDGTIAQVAASGATEAFEQGAGKAISAAKLLFDTALTAGFGGASIASKMAAWQANPANKASFSGLAANAVEQFGMQRLPAPVQAAIREYPGSFPKGNEMGAGDDPSSPPSTPPPTSPPTPPPTSPPTPPPTNPNTPSPKSGDRSSNPAGFSPSQSNLDSSVGAHDWNTDSGSVSSMDTDTGSNDFSPVDSATGEPIISTGKINSEAASVSNAVANSGAEFATLSGRESGNDRSDLKNKTGELSNTSQSFLNHSPNSTDSQVGSVASLSNSMASVSTASDLAEGKKTDSAINSPNIKSVKDTNRVSTTGSNTEEPVSSKAAIVSESASTSDLSPTLYSVSRPDVPGHSPGSDLLYSQTNPAHGRTSDTSVNLMSGSETPSNVGYSSYQGDSTLVAPAGKASNVAQEILPVSDSKTNSPGLTTGETQPSSSISVPSPVPSAVSSPTAVDQIRQGIFAKSTPSPRGIIFGGDGNPRTGKGVENVELHSGSSPVEVSKSSSFQPQALSSLLSQHANAGRTVKFDPLEKKFAPSEEGSYLLWQEGTGDEQQNYVVPITPRLATGSEYTSNFAEVFHCDNPKSGELLISKPAKVDNQLTLLDLGELTVLSTDSGLKGRA